MSVLADAVQGDAAATSALLKSTKDVIFWVDPLDTRPPAKEPIDWECPCLGDMTRGPCASAFKEAFECVHYAADASVRDECRPKMEAMAACVTANREQYRSYAEMLDDMRADAAARTMVNESQSQSH
jgi:intermembrane space import and assembly protein 40